LPSAAGFEKSPAETVDTLAPARADDYSPSNYSMEIENPPVRRENAPIKLADNPLFNRTRKQPCFARCWRAG
jgi:hypothetical protein